MILGKNLDKTHRISTPKNFFKAKYSSKDRIFLSILDFSLKHFWKTFFALLIAKLFEMGHVIWKVKSTECTKWFPRNVIFPSLFGGYWKCLVFYDIFSLHFNPPIEAIVLAKGILMKKVFSRKLCLSVDEACVEKNLLFRFFHK